MHEKSEQGGAPKLEATGERFIPKEMMPDVEAEHWHRYLMATNFVRGKRVLDIASGDGYGSNLLAGHAHHVTGVDISAEAVAYAARTYDQRNLRFMEGSCAAIPAADRSFDVVVSFETLEHHDLHEEMFREIRRVLVPGGLLIVSTPDRLVYSEQARYANPYHVKELAAAEFRELVGRYFRHCHMLGQIYAVGSLLSCADAGPAGGFAYYRQSELGATPQAAQPQAKYLIAFASDAQIEAAAGAASFLENASYFGEQQAEMARLNRLLVELQASVQSAREERDAYKSAMQDHIAESARLRGRLEAATQASSPPAAEDHGANLAIAQTLEDVGTMLEQRMASRDRTIREQHEQLRQLQLMQQQLQQELLRADTQLDFLKELLQANLGMETL